MSFSESRDENISSLKLVARAPAVLRADESGRILSCSANIEDVGLRQEEVLGKHWHALFPGFRKTPVTTVAGPAQFILEREDGNGPSYRVVVHKNLAANGAPDGLLVTVEHRGNHSASALAELEKTQCLGWMACEFAHELNNTLTSVCGWLQILMEDLPEGDASRQSLEVVYNESKRTARMAASMLAMARGRSGEPHVPLDLNALLDDVLVFIEPSLAKAGIELKRQFGEAPAVSGSETELRQLFMNLLLNAANAIENEGCISVATEVSNDARVCARVSDTGCGISPEALDRIFEPFYTTRSESGGTGLGLFVCRRIVRQHNGDLLVESVAGQGSTFTVLLPPAGGGDTETTPPPDGAEKK